MIMEFETDNEHKIYVVKRSKCGHFFVNQKIKGKLFYRRYTRLPKRYLKTFLPI